jgi:CheY-like chemotaxis protein
MRMRLSMLLPNWGMRVTTVENTQEALDRLRAAATQGPPWAYAIVLADLSGMRTTALALHRNLERHAIYGDVRLICLYGDEQVPEELTRSVTLLSRQAPDADLRAALTAKPPAPEPAVSVAPPAEGEAETGNSIRSARVLLVEDNPVNLMVGQRLLSVLGVDCDTANNGEVALLRMSGSRYDLVLMDCQMPVVDGYTATRRWREAEDHAGDGSHLPIIAMTANAMAGDRQKCLDAGMDDYLAKPVTRAELERCLHRWWRPRAPDTRPSMPPTVIAMVQAAAPVAPADPSPELSPVATTEDEAPAIQPTPAAVIDREVFDELRGVLGTELDNLIELFLDDTPMLLARLEAAALAPDFNELREAAHSLKSSSANLGAMALSAAAKRVELGARLQTLDRPAVAVALIASEFARARTALMAAADNATQPRRPSDSLSA